MTVKENKEHHIDIFPWQTSFNTGLTEIDQQHQTLVGLINRIASQVTYNPDKKLLESSLAELFNYTDYHFKCEEGYFFNTLPNDSETQKHQKQHQAFIKQLKQFNSELHATPPTLEIEDLLAFLAGWLATHILNSDKHLVLKAQAIQSGMTDEEATAYADEKMQGAAKTIVNVIVFAYQNLATNTLKLMKEIRAKKKTLSLLTEVDNRLEMAMEYAQIAYWSTTSCDSITDYSAQLYRLFGLPEETHDTFISLLQTKHGEFYHQLKAAIKESFANHSDVFIVCPIIRTDNGNHCWIECKGYITTNKNTLTISGFMQDITQRKRVEEKIAQLAYFDSLTGLPNRRLLLDRLQQTILSCARENTNNAILFLDIDEFKTVNDSHGHKVGDALLKEASKRIGSCLRQSDTLARFGGDEFVVILPRLESSTLYEDHVRKVADKLLWQLSQTFQLNQLQFNVGVSIGIVMFNDDSRSESELLKQADIAMYRAKQLGKNRVCFFDSKMQEIITTRLLLDNELREALEKEQFELFYQPQLNQHNEVIGAEALIRWRHPNQGIIGPNIFIPRAEETGLIIAIGEWVLKTACHQLMQWQRDPKIKPLQLAINASYKQFCDPNFVPLIEQLVADYKLPSQSLKIELTESILANDIERLIKQINRLKQHGICFSVDDFGTGYSSLKYLKTLPIDQVKIDRSFVNELVNTTSDQSIVNAIISMSQAFGFNTLAEGVELIEQKMLLEKMGCFTFQGFYFSKPLPLAEFEQYLLNH